ncbi:hypothetical protein [Falsigemmobacter faecalis]|uniref:Uncharacterized protein n=1 Tax=Falsigemmobacter faecalis TaxID=2488730 RepID=A0A3P3D657_9RHOB|nr:hypothetical protein [Falsigemmobacter faecalis]RRH69870.1 hypothetical protein EG244_17870 [Falsigemmobacter faecalis]
MSEKARLELEARRAQAELSAALSELRGTLEPAVHLVEKGAEMAGAGLERGAKLLGAVSSAGGSVAGTAQSVAQKLSDAAAPLTGHASGEERATQVASAAGAAGLAGVAIWGVKRLLSKGDSADPVPDGPLPAVLDALLPRRSADLTDKGGAWLSEADSLRREADRQLNKIERALARGKGDPDDLIAHRDEVLETLTNGLKITFSRGLEKLDPATRTHVLQKRGEDYAAHLAQLEAEAGGGGLTGALRRHPLLTGGAVLVAGAAAAYLLPRGAVTAAAGKAAPVVGSLAKDVAIGAVSRTGLLGSLAGLALKRMMQKPEPEAQAPQPTLLASDQPGVPRSAMVLDQYGAPAQR